MSRERPILFSGPMVRAILDGRKTQTRRIVKPGPPDDWAPTVGWYNPAIEDRTGMLVSGPEIYGASDEDFGLRCRIGVPGDLLWVKETFDHSPATYVYEASVSIPAVEAETIYRADCGDDATGPWRPSIFMPRCLSRITLRITEVRVERLQQISRCDALAEGIYGDSAGYHWKHPAPTLGYMAPQQAYAALWESINGKGSVEANPWVWVVTFERVDAAEARHAG